MPNTGHDLNWSINTKPLGTISENITAKHRSLSQMIYQCQTNGHDLRDYQCKTLGTIATILSIPNHWAWFQRLSSKTLGTISTILSMPNHWAWSQRLSIQNSGHNLNYSINAKHWALSQRLPSSNPGHISTILSMPNTGHYLRDYQCQTLGTISTNLSMPNAGHNINYSINAKRWAQSQLFYQYQTTGHDLWDYQYQTLDTISTILSMPNTGHDLNWSINAKHWTWSLRLLIPHTGHYINYSINTKPLSRISTILLIPNHWAQSQLFYQCQTTEHNLINLYAKRGTITSPKVIKKKSIPTNVYLDIYVTD